jgi:hypothetical protein
MVEYEAQELWYGQAFVGTKTGNPSEHKKCHENALRLRDEAVNEILAKVKGCHLSRRDTSATEGGTRGEVSFPPLILEKQLASSKVSFDCRIHINLCSPNEHWCVKTWVIIGADSKQNSDRLKEFFESMERDAEVIAKVIEKDILNQTNILLINRGGITSYPIRIRNVGKNGKGSGKDVFRLFETDEEEEAIELLKKQETRDIVSDLLKLNDKSVNHGLSIERLKAVGILWRLMKNYSHLGETNFVYGCNFQDNYARIAGFSNVGHVKTLHTLFRPKVLQIIYGL